jgi:hypothetical protein
MANAERSDSGDENEEIRAVVPAKTPAQLTTKPTIRTTVTTTKKQSSFNFDSLANVLTSGFNAVGHIANAIGNIKGKKNKIFYLS